jgi:hypothetical protein
MQEAFDVQVCRTSTAHIIAAHQHTSTPPHHHTTTPPHHHTTTPPHHHTTTLANCSVRSIANYSTAPKPEIQDEIKVANLPITKDGII